MRRPWFEAAPRSVGAPRLRLVALLGLCAIGLGFGGAPALAAGDAKQGEQLARRWCAACHIVASDQTHGADNVPTFSTISKIPGFDAGKIAKFLMDPHPKMPDMEISRGEAQDLGAYIASLAK